MKYILLSVISFGLITYAFTQEGDTTGVVYSWQVSEENIILPVEIDTNPAYFQIFNPIFQKSISNAYLGNMGSPNRPNIFIYQRHHHYIFLNPFLDFLHTNKNTVYYNTRKPFTLLTFTHGGTGQTKEETLKVIHSQNITPIINVGLNYDLISSLGQYAMQKVKNNRFKFFSSYVGDNYNVHGNVNINKIIADENGGLTLDSNLDSADFKNDIKLIPTVFSGTDYRGRHNPDVYNTIKYIDFNVIQEYNFLKESSDTVSTKHEAASWLPVLIYDIGFIRSSRFYTDVNTSSGVYENYFVNKTSTRDSSYYFTLKNQLKFKWEFKPSAKNKLVIKGTLRNDREKYAYFTPDEFYTDSTKLDTITPSYSMFNPELKLPTTFNSVVFSNWSFGMNFDWTVYENTLFGLDYKQYFSGYYANNYSLSANVSHIFDNKDILDFSVSKKKEKTAYPLSYYTSNNFIWANSFKDENNSSVSIRYVNASNKFKLHVNSYLLCHKIYFDTIAIPKQHDGTIFVFSLQAIKDLAIWKFRSRQHLVYQYVDDNNIIRIPEISYFSSTYFEHDLWFKLTNGHILFMLGFDIYYNTAFYAPSYMPATSTFYHQNEKKLGNYPYVDVFLNAKLKRTRFFLKYEHVNHGLLESNYFDVLHYPRNQGMFKYGISWSFYD